MGWTCLQKVRLQLQMIESLFLLPHDHHSSSYLSTTSYCRFELEHDELVLLRLDMLSLSLSLLALGVDYCSSSPQ